MCVVGWTWGGGLFLRGGLNRELTVCRFRILFLLLPIWHIIATCHIWVQISNSLIYFWNCWQNVVLFFSDMWLPSSILTKIFPGKKEQRMVLSSIMSFIQSSWMEKQWSERFQWSKTLASYILQFGANVPSPPPYTVWIQLQSSSRVTNFYFLNWL